MKSQQTLSGMKEGALSEKEQLIVRAKYRLVEKLSDSSYGTIYRAQHISRDYPVIIKFVRVYSSCFSTPGR